MGRKTFETLNKPLPGRTHLVITSNHNYKVPEGHEVVHSLEEAIAIGKEKGLEKFLFWEVQKYTSWPYLIVKK